MAGKKAQDILRVDNLSVKLAGKLILNGINTNVREGEILGIVGVSGAGKTTLLNAIIGYYPTISGSVSYYLPRMQKFVFSRDFTNNFKSLFGFSAQNPSFYPELTVLENLEYFASLYDVPENVKKYNIKKALKLVNLENHASVPAKVLSGGMKKRLDIACAIAHGPQILVLDEPTSDMDPPLRLQIWGLIEMINGMGTTIILASHFLSEIEHMCDRIIFLHNKEVKFSGSVENFRNLYSKTKEISVTTKDGKYDVILEKLVDIQSIRITHINRKKGHIVFHSNEEINSLKSAIVKSIGRAENISKIEIRNPSMDMLFKLFVEK